MVLNALGQSTDIKKVEEKLLEISLKRMHRPETLANQPLDTILFFYNDKEGFWEDIDYQGNNLAAWEPAQHWRRLHELAWDYRYNKNDGSYSEKRLRQIQKGIDFWIQHAFSCSNYWWNAIGVPLDMGRVLILVGEENLPAPMLNAVLEKMRLGIKEDYYDYHGVATGQNLLWLATVHLYTAVFENDEAALKRAFNEIQKEIAYNPAEGIQLDESFHQHGNQYYSFGYGRVFTLYIAQLAYLANNTQFEFPIEKIEQISRFILDGQQWIMYKEVVDYNAKGRTISREKVSTDVLLWAAEMMVNIDGERKDEYIKLIQDYDALNQSQYFRGNKHFWYSDLMVHKRPQYYMSVKMASKRIIATEILNGENLQGYYLSNGINCLYRSGKEYKGIFPLWDWKKLPGLLAEQDDQPLPVDKQYYDGVNTAFVGGVSNGQYGFAVYDYEKRDKLSAKRAWFFFDDEIVHLVSGLQYVGEGTLFQSINQCLAQSAVSWKIDEEVKSTEDPFQVSTNTSWVHHDSIGYVIPEYLKTHISVEERKKSWKEINANIHKEVQKKIFTLGIDLGNRLSVPDSCHYIILPNVSAENMNETIQDLGYIKLLANNAQIQAIHHQKLQQFHIAFHQPTHILLDSHFNLSVSHPVLVLIEKKDDKRFDISLSNPMNKGLEVIMTIDKHVSCKDCFWSKEKEESLIKFSILDDKYAGKTITKTLILNEE